MKKKFDESVRERVFEARRQGKTLREISPATGVSMTTVKTWLSDAAKKNTAGIRIRRYFSTDEQKMIFAEYANIHSAIAICNKYRIDKSTLLRWKAKAAVIAASQCGTVYTAAQLYKMQRELKTLRLENQIIRLCRCTVSAPHSGKSRRSQTAEWAILSPHAMPCVEFIQGNILSHLFGQKGKNTIRKE